MITSDHPLYFLASRIQPEGPSGFEPVTRSIKLQSEIAIIESIWETMRHTECVVTVTDGKLVFWRQRNRGQETSRLRIRRSIKTVGPRIYTERKAA
jgi:hypothetical protein